MAKAMMAALLAVATTAFMVSPAQAVEFKPLKDPIFKKIPIGVEITLNDSEANDLACILPQVGANLGPAGVVAFGIAKEIVKRANKGRGVVLHYTAPGIITGVHSR